MPLLSHRMKKLFKKKKPSFFNQKKKEEKIDGPLVAKMGGPNHPKKIKIKIKTIG